MGPYSARGFALSACVCTFLCFASDTFAFVDTLRDDDGLSTHMYTHQGTDADASEVHEEPGRWLDVADDALSYQYESTLVVSVYVCLFVCVCVWAFH